MSPTVCDEIKGLQCILEPETLPSLLSTGWFQKHPPHCLVLVGSRNRFKRDITIKLKSIEGLMEDRLKCQITPLLNIVKSICTMGFASL